MYFFEQCGFMRAIHLFCNKASARSECLGGPGVFPFQEPQRSCRTNAEFPQGRLIKVHAVTSTQYQAQDRQKLFIEKEHFNKSTHMSTLFGKAH